MLLYLLVFIFFVLQCLDWYTTHTIIKNGGYEQNPIMAWLFKKIGMDLTLGIKVILVTWIGYLLTMTPLVIQIKEITIDFLIHYTLDLNIDFTIPTPTLIIPPIILYIWVVKHNWKSL
jgi:hypothetical protein